MFILSIAGQMPFSNFVISFDLVSFWCHLLLFVFFDQFPEIIFNVIAPACDVLVLLEAYDLGRHSIIFFI